MACPKCGSKKFTGHQIQRWEIEIDDKGNYEDQIECYDSESAYGPFTCMGCGAEFDELPE